MGYHNVVLKAISEFPKFEEKLIRLDPMWMINFAHTSGRSDLLYKIVEYGTVRAAKIALKEIEMFEDLDLLTLKNLSLLSKPGLRSTLRRLIANAEKRKRISINLFGGFEIIKDGKAISLKSNLAKKIIALLVMRAQHTVSAQELTEIFWSDGYQKSRGRLYFTINQIRKIHHQLIIKETNGYRLRLDFIHSDYLQFYEFLNRGFALSRRDQKQSIAYLRQALQLSNQQLIPNLDDPVFDIYKEIIKKKREQTEQLISRFS